jgi:hypothetical protein
VARRRALNICGAAALVLALSACNAAFGLVPTTGPDSDGDGRPDDDDNCPLVANPDQANQDGDTLGDACDPCDGPQTGTDNDHDGIDDGCDACLTGRNTDEDRDTYLDGCDTCPGTLDDQSDGDGDGIGNACDAEPGVQNHRVFFDGFDPPLADWRAWLTTWEATGDGGYQPLVDGGGGTGAWNPASAVTGNEFWFETVIDIPSQPFSGDYRGLNLLTRAEGSNVTLCWIQWDTGGWHPASDDLQKIPLGATVRVRYRAHGGADECTFDGIQVPLFDPSLAPDTYVAGLATRRSSPVRWIDVVSR